MVVHFSLLKSENNIHILNEAADGQPYCCVDVLGNIHLISDSLSSFLGTSKDKVGTIFQIAPSINMLSWKEYFEGLEKAGDIKTSILLQDDLVKCTVRFVPFILREVKYLQLIIITDNDEGADSDERASQSEGYSYDKYCPNPVLYFDDQGRLTYLNQRMQELIPSKDNVDFAIDDLFLESELGPLVEGISTYPRKDKQLSVRMIMRSKEGIKEGYSRLSVHLNQNAPGPFRLEFLESDGMQLLDAPLEKAMAELDRASSLVQSTKDTLKESSLDNFSLNDIITRSPDYKKVLRQVAQVADTPTTVLITGETGTGKELLANAIYQLSDRSDDIFVKINCASIPRDLLESTLFGHTKGSFTGADSNKTGKFELADGGTIFLDEIGEIPLELQAKLLRVLQEGEVDKIGSTEPIKVDVRVIAATNRNLPEMIKKGEFRSDLFYRLNVFPIYNIPLRERKEDIEPLAKFFLNKMAIKTGRNVHLIRNKDLAFLSQYDFPGNVRELENMIERAVIISTEDYLDLSFFFASSGRNSTNHGVFPTLEESIRQHLIQALTLSKGKVTGENSASEILNVNGKTLVSKLKKYDIDPKSYKE